MGHWMSRPSWGSGPMASLQQINVGVWNEIFRGHPQGAHELVRLGLTIPCGISLSEDDLEFKKVPESLDPVEMDTGPADEVEVADFPDHGLFPVGGSEDMAQSGGIGSGSKGVVGGLGSLLVRALVENEFTPLRAEDAELEATGGAGEEDIFLLDDDRFGAGQFPGPPGGVLVVGQMGLDFDVASHREEGRVFRGRGDRRDYFFE